jgi:hypothetical protein
MDSIEAIFAAVIDVDRALLLVALAWLGVLGLLLGALALEALLRSKEVRRGFPWKQAKFW